MRTFNNPKGPIDPEIRRIKIRPKKFNFDWISPSLAVFVVANWVKNLIALTNCDFATPYKCEIIHAVGLYLWLGVITAWLDVGR